MSRRGLSYFERSHDLYSSSNIRECYSGVEIKKDAVSAAFGMYGGRREVRAGCFWEKLRERDHLDDGA